MSADALALFPDLDGHWLPSFRCDPRALGLYRRHYSAQKSRRWAGWLPGQRTHFLGPGEVMVLLTADCRALFAWQRNTIERLDGQTGVNCAVFRNEGPVLSSDLIREACALAWRRWPGERLFTYVWDAKVASANPGYCFKRAGWRTCGRNADGRLTILEIFPITEAARPPDARTEQPEQEAERPAAPQRHSTAARSGSNVQGQPAALGRAT